MKLEKTVGDEGWTDRDGKLHLHASPAGFGGPLPLHAVDLQRVGRAALLRDLRKVLFSGDKAASSVKRPNPPPVVITAADEQKRRERREQQTRALSSKAI